MIALARAGLRDGSRWKFDAVTGPPKIRRHPKRPNVFHEADHRIIFVGKDDIDGKLHEKHMDGPRLGDDEAVTGGKERPAEEADQAGNHRVRGFAFGGNERVLSDVMDLHVEA